MRTIAGWLLAAALAAQGLTLGYGLASEAGGGWTVLTVRGVLVAVVLTGAMAFLLVWKRSETLAEREVPRLMNDAVVALGSASVLLMTAAHLSIAHKVPMSLAVDPAWLMGHGPSVVIALFTSVATEAAAASVAWVWPSLPIAREVPEYLANDWQAIRPEPATNGEPFAANAAKRSYKIEQTDAGFVAVCSCGWPSEAKSEEIAAKRAWSAHRCEAASRGETR